MGMTPEEIQKAAEGIAKLTSMLVYIAKETAKEDKVQEGGIPSALFNAFQEVAIEEVEKAVNSGGPETAFAFIGVQMRVVKNFVEIMQDMETQIKEQKKKFDIGRKSENNDNSQNN